MVRTGLDLAVAWLRGERYPDRFRLIAELLTKGKLGLITNPSASTRDLTFSVDALHRAGAKLGALFGTEHGIRGEIADGVKIEHSTDPRTGLRVWSLYGEHRAPTAEMLRGLDALVFDIQDVGARFYTFSSSLSHAMVSAAQAGLPVIVLDRPNPLGGVAIEGPILEKQHATFVGLHPIPIRHAATMGELGRLWHRFGAGDEPLVLPCQGWRRKERWAQTELQWIAPSPNIPTPETALIYPGTCLLEGTNVSEARGTTGPFRWFGAPWVEPEALAERLNGAGLPGVRFRATRFKPTSSKHQGVDCAGCEIHILDPEALRPVATGVAILSALRHAYPKDFEWRRSGARFSVDRLAGTSRLREAIDAGKSWREISQEWEAGVRDYRAKLEGIALYR